MGERTIIYQPQIIRETAGASIASTSETRCFAGASSNS